MKFCHRKEDVPIDHWAVVRFTSIYIEGDERSRTHPGHGYPDEYRPVAEYIAFDSQIELQTWIEKNYTDNNFVVIWASPKKVVTSVLVDLA